MAGSSRRWHYYYLLIAVAFAAAFTAVAPQQALAHPVYVDSSPGAFASVQAVPGQVSVFFSEPIELEYSRVSVLGPDGNEVDTNDPQNVEGDTSSIGVALQPGLPEGVYTVTTRVLSAVDGHVVENTFTFGVGTEVAPGPGGRQPETILSFPESASRFPGMVGQVIVVGAAFGMLWLWKPIARVPWLSSAMSEVRPRIDRSMMRLIIIGAGLVLASGVAMIVVQAISIEAGIPEAIATKFGNVWITRMLQASILMAIAVAVYAKSAKTGPGRAEMFAILILGLAVLVTSSLIAHAAATEQVGAIVLDFFHNAAASVWIGGLVLLGFVAVPKILAIADERARSAAISILIPRFSTVVVTILGLSVITGPLLLYAIESDLSLTLASVYGQVLAVKLGLAGVMVALGAYSQFVVQKKAVAVMSGGSSQAAAAPATLRHYGKSLKVEAGVGIALLLMVSLMANGTLPSGQFPAYQRQDDGDREAFAEVNTDLSQTIYGTNGRIQLEISPFVVGQNHFVMSFLDTEGDNATGVGSARLKLTQAERGIGPISIDTKKQSDNTFAADAAFSLPGAWTIEIEGVRTEGANILGTLEANVKPQVSSLEFAVETFPVPDRGSPLYPVFDSERQSIWVGDTRLGTGRIWQFDIATGNYTAHGIEGANIITQSVLAPDGRLWYIDPLAAQPNGTLGLYDPATKSAEQFVIPEQGVATGLAMDGSGNLWVPISQPNKVVKFEPATGQFSSYAIPTAGSIPVAISADGQGNIWFAEAKGKIAKIDPATGNITEYAPPSQRGELDEPTAVFPDPRGSTIYVSEHTGHTITAFSPLLGTFHQYPSINDSGLPFGMAMDSYGNLWYAEHQIDRIAVIDPRTGAGAEVKIPITGSTIQYLTTDDSGKIWFAAQRGTPSLGSIAITAKPAAPQQLANGTQQGGPDPIPQLGFSLADVAGPAIAFGVALSALFYAKGAIDLSRNTRAAQKQGRE